MSRLWDLYGEERDKLSQLPDADDDYIALEKAMERVKSEGNKEEGDCYQ